VALDALDPRRLRIVVGDVKRVVVLLEAVPVVPQEGAGGGVADVEAPLDGLGKRGGAEEETEERRHDAHGATIRQEPRSGPRGSATMRRMDSRVPQRGRVPRAEPV